MKKLFKDDPHWRVREIVNQNTGEITNRYFYKLRKCHKIILTSRLANQLAGYILIEKDLRNILFWLDKITPFYSSSSEFHKEICHQNTDREKYNHVKGLFVAAITFYGKCFTKCEGRKVKLERSNLDKEYREDHDSLIELRNNYTAHSGAQYSEKVSIQVILDSKRKSKKQPRVVTELRQPDSFNYTDHQKFIEITKHLQSFAKNKMDKLISKIHKDEVYSKDVDYWYQKVNNS